MNKAAPQQRVDRAPRPSVREQIAAGPVFIPVDGTCIGCMREDENVVDKDTGLGALCWRAWRWSPIREREIPDT